MTLFNIHFSNFQPEMTSETSSSARLEETTPKQLEELNETLSRLKKESEDEIQKLKQKSADASKTIADLQQKLNQQSDYEIIKREIQ